MSVPAGRSPGVLPVVDHEPSVGPPSRAASHPPVTKTTTRTREYAAASLVALAAVLVYLNSLGNGFALDDTAIIASNARVHDLANLRAIWLTPYWPEFGVQLGLYRPMAIFVYALQWAAAGGEPWVFHAVNVLLHALVTVLGFRFLRLWTGRGPALAGALAFAVHPVHTEAVANAVGQAELVVAAALLGACLLHASRPATEEADGRRWAGIAGLFAIALFTKESAIVLPGLLLLIDVAQGRVSNPRQYAGSALKPFLLLGLISAGYLAVRFTVLEGALLGGKAWSHLWFLQEHRLLNALRAFPEFLRLLVFPQQLSSDYSPAVLLPNASFTPMIGAGLFLVAALVLLVLLWPWAPPLAFASAWFLCTVLPVSNLLFPIGAQVAERTLYLPSFAVSIVLAFAWPEEWPRGMRRALVAAVAALAVGAAAWRTWTRNPDWASTLAVQSALIRDHPESYRAQWLLGEHFARTDRARALRHYDLAYRIYPRDSEFLTAYAELLFAERQFEAARRLALDAFRLHPEVLRSTSLLIHASLAAGYYEEALPLIGHLEAIGAPLSVTMVMRANAYDGLGEPARASAAWRVALARGAGDSGTWVHLARSLAQAGYGAAAARAASRGATLARDSAAARAASELAAALRSGCHQASAAVGTGAAHGSVECAEPGDR